MDCNELGWWARYQTLGVTGCVRDHGQHLEPAPAGRSNRREELLTQGHECASTVANSQRLPYFWPRSDLRRKHACHSDLWTKVSLFTQRDWSTWAAPLQPTKPCSSLAHSTHHRFRIGHKWTAATAQRNVHTNENYVTSKLFMHVFIMWPTQGHLINTRFQ